MIVRSGGNPEVRGFGGSKVVGGRAKPDLVPFTDAQENAVVALMDGCRVVCTGTLVAPWAVLSAAHCGLRAGVRVVVGPEAAEPLEEAEVSEVVVAPGRDVALARLSRVLSPPAIPVTLFDLASFERVQAAGYGRTQPGVPGNTQRWWVSEPVAVTGDGWFRVDGEGRHGLCAGDSGGPAFVAGPRIVGVVSQGEATCVGADIFAVPDPDWVQGVLRSWGGPGKRSWATPRLIAGIGLVGGLLVVGMLSARSRGGGTAGRSSR